MSTKHPATAHHSKKVLPALRIIILCGLYALAFLTAGWYGYESKYRGKIYPVVMIDGIRFGGQTPGEVESYWASQNIPFESAVFEFTHEGLAATVSGEAIGLGYDAALSAAQAYSIGRSGNFIQDTTTKFFRGPIRLSPYFRWETSLVSDTVDRLASQIDIPVREALFRFERGRVAEFRPSSNGRQVDKADTLRRFESAVSSLPHAPLYHIVINVPVLTVVPKVTTENVNTYGIRERIGVGYSEFPGSIPGRIHNVALAASRINGILIPPGETFSFNDAVGDISAATGYQSAYIIKEGRTVLGDGGGVCQVSSTLFRAALNAGLPITERHAHAYRVHYYEEAGYKAGLDATVFSPGVDLKFTNNTPAHILVQAIADTKNLSLTFEFYGTPDGRSSEILDHVVYGQSPPPAPLYQDDPTLKTGVIRQVDWEAWGAKASFTYRVTRGNEVLEDEVFVSNYRPWQAVYLRGTMP